jgi:hypothetical protein
MRFETCIVQADTSKKALDANLSSAFLYVCTRFTQHDIHILSLAILKCSLYMHTLLPHYEIHRLCHDLECW